MSSWQINGVDLTRWLEFHITNKYKKSSLSGEIEDYYLRRWYQNGQMCEAPLSVVINLTNKCNLRCKHCSKGAELSNHEIALENIKRILDECFASKVFTIVVTGGEPLLHSKITEVIKMIKQYGFSIKILTNLNIDSRKLETILSLLNPCTDVFQVSVDDLSVCYERIRKGASFEKLTYNISILKNFGFKITVNMVVTKENVNHMVDVFAYCVEQGIDGIRFTPYFGNDSSEKLPGIESMITNFDLVLELFDQKKSNTSINSDPISILYPFFEELKSNSDFCYGTDYYTCPACVTNMEINTYGYAYPCSYLDDEQYYGGNVITDSIENIWRSDTFERFRQYVSDDEACSRCSQHEHCRGGCKADIIVHHGRLNGHDNGCWR